MPRDAAAGAGGRAQTVEKSTGRGGRAHAEVPGGRQQTWAAVAGARPAGGHGGGGEEGGDAVLDPDGPTFGLGGAAASGVVHAGGDADLKPRVCKGEAAARSAAPRTVKMRNAGLHRQGQRTHASRNAHANTCRWRPTRTMCEKRFRNGHGDNAVGMGTTCHHRSVVDRHRSQHPDRGHKGVHQRLYTRTTTPRDRHGIRKDLH
jgi:hypothetical protein